MDPTLDSETLFLLVDYLKRNETLAPVAEQLEILITEHRMLGCGERWDGTSYTRSYDDLIRKFPLASTAFRNRILQRGDDEEPRPAWISLAGQRIFPCNTVLRRIQNRALYGRLRACPPSLHSRYRHIKTTWGHHGPVFCVAFDRTGKRVITGSDDHRVKVWRTCDGALEFSLLGHTAPISDIAVSACNIFVGSASADFTVRLWYLRDGLIVRVVQLNAEVTRLVFHSEYVICTTMDGCAHALLLSDATSHDVLTAPRPVAQPTTCEALSVSISPCQQLFAVGYSHGHVGFFSVDLLGEGFMSPFSDVDISTSGEIVTVAFSTIYSEECPLRIAVGSHSGKFHILSRNDNGLFDIQHALVHSEIRQPEPANLVVILTWAADDTKLVTTYHNSIHVWSTISGDLLFHRAIRGHGSDILSMSVHPVYKDALFTVSVDGSAIVSSLIDGSEIVKFPATDIYQLIDCSFSPNGDFICATSDLGRLVFFGTGSRRRHAKLPDSQFFTFENPATDTTLNDLHHRVLCDAEFEVYNLQPRHLIQSYIAHDLSEADSTVDSDDNEALRPPPPPIPFVDFDETSFDPHVAISVVQVPEAPERHLSEEEESFSMSSDTENEEEDDIDEAVSDEDLESFQIPANLEIGSERRGPNTRRTRRHDSGSDSDRPIRRRNWHWQIEEAGNAPDSEAIPYRRRPRRRRRGRRQPDPSQVLQITNAVSNARPTRQRRVERTASQQSALSNRSSNRNLRESLQAPLSENIVSHLRGRSRSSAGSIPQEQSVTPVAASAQRRVMPRRQNVLNNQQANPVSASPSRIRTRSSISSAAALPSLAISARVTRQSTANSGASDPGTPPRRSSTRVVPQSDQPLRARRPRTELDSAGLQLSRSAYHTRSHSIVAAGSSVYNTAAQPANDIISPTYNTRSQANIAVVATGRTTRTSQMAVESSIVSSLIPLTRRNHSNSRSPQEERVRARSFTPPRTRSRRRSPNRRIWRELSESSGDDVPVRLLPRRRINEEH